MKKLLNDNYELILPHTWNKQPSVISWKHQSSSLQLSMTLFKILHQ